MFLIIRYAKASDSDHQCELCTKFLDSEGFKLLCMACMLKNESLEIIDLNVDPRAEKFYKLFPSGDIMLPAIINGKKIIKRIDALHPFTLLSMLFGDISSFGLVEIRETGKIMKKVIPPSSLEVKIMTLIKAGFTAEEIAKKINISKKRVQEIVEKVKNQQVK